MFNPIITQVFDLKFKVKRIPKFRLIENREMNILFIVTPTLALLVSLWLENSSRLII
jgi:hypothetical protein